MPLAALALGALLPISTASAHGGQISGPVVLHPVNAPPPSTSGPGSGPTTGGGTRSRPGSGSTGSPTQSAPGPTGKGRSTTSSATTGTVPLEERDAWEFWWTANRDEPLHAEDDGVPGTPRSANGAPLTGRGSRTAAGDPNRPDEGLVHLSVTPALLALVAHVDDRDVLDSAILALARSARPGDEELVLAAARTLLSHRELTVKASAALSLGVLGSPQALPLLHSLALDDSTGRQAVGGGHVPDQVRAFAAVSLGLIGHAVAIPTLVAIGREGGSGSVDLPACAVLALGLLPEDPGGDAAAFLAAALTDRRLDANVRAQVPIALARLGRREAVPALLALLARDSEESLVRQSCAIALGKLATPDDREVLDALAEAAREAKDAPTRHFALMSLARAGARGPDEPHPARGKLLDAFAADLRHPGTPTDRPWTAIAIGLLGRTQREARDRLGEPLAEAYRDQKDPSVRGAYALALGLSGQTALADRLLEAFRATSDLGFRADAALALGFLRHAPSAEVLRQVCTDRATAPPLRIAAAQALGLLGDPAAVPVLVEALHSDGSQPMLSAVAKSLGLLADRKAVAPLLALAGDESAPDLARAFACVGLGLCCERTRLPWNARLREDGNYLARVPAIDELLDIL